MDSQKCELLLGRSRCLEVAVMRATEPVRKGSLCVFFEQGAKALGATPGLINLDRFCEQVLGQRYNNFHTRTVGHDHLNIVPILLSTTSV
jgi:hypothetical protein